VSVVVMLSRVRAGYTAVIKTAASAARYPKATGFRSENIAMFVAMVFIIVQGC
jgi:hypothetical protein